MEINKGTHDKLVDMINLFVHSDTFELEGKYKGDVSKEAFSRCIQHCKSAKYVETIHKETMDIVTRQDGEQYRISVVGKDNIAVLFKTNKLPSNTKDITMMKKSFIKGVKPLLMEDIFFKVDLKDEASVPENIQGEISLRLPSLDKGFRFKQRYSYVDTENGVRYDFTIVRTSRYNGVEFVTHKTMNQSGVLSAKETYEVEVELLREKENKKTKTALAKAMLTSFLSMYLSILDEKYYTSSTEKTEVLKNYLKLCYVRENISLSLLLKNAAFRPKEYFIGPQPVTLERKNVIPPGLGIVSIFENYTVTEKADGERCLLFVNNDGKCYLMNNRLNLKYTGVKLNKVVNTIIDGELITSDKFGRKVNMFAMFDVYYYNSTDVKGLPLVHDGKSGWDEIDKSEKNRVSLMQQFASHFKEQFASQGVQLFAKEFKYGDILEVSKELINKNMSGGYAYNIDGLIYTPKYFAVGGQFLKDKPTNVRTWEMVYKWKPPHDNTIDFLVQLEKDETGNHSVLVKDDKYCKIATLNVGYNPSIHERLTARKFLTNDLKFSKSYVPKEFIPYDVIDDSISRAFLQIVEQQGTNFNKITPKCINGDAIEDNSIVEFAYDKSKGSVFSQHWVPLRVRYDKTDMYRRFGLSHTANDYKTAMNVWSSIQSPVTEEIITGKQVISPDDILDEDIYFSSTLDRYKYASLTMKNFHNEYIKKRELLLKMQKGSTVFDIACGKAGDLKKWIDAGFSKVMGIDVVRDNIENRKNGAYARTLEARTKFGVSDKKAQFVYLTADASKKINTEYVENMDDEDDKYVAKVLMGITRPSQIQDETMVKYSGFMKGGFDVISCQFAIHYFFENETTLSNFIYNVDNNLKQGGCLIGTCLDGFRVKEKLYKIKKGESIKGVRDDRVLWNIKKLYTNDNSIKLGEQIEIYMESIGKPIKEFIVDFNLLKVRLAEKGIEVLRVEDCNALGIEKSIESFQTSYNKVVNSDDKSQLAKDIRVMSQEEKDYSFLNSWFIFKKY